MVFGFLSQCECLRCLPQSVNSPWDYCILNCLDEVPALALEKYPGGEMVGRQTSSSRVDLALTLVCDCCPEPGERRPLGLKL